MSDSRSKLHVFLEVLNFTSYLLDISCVLYVYAL